MFQYRPFLNTDPPAIAQIWNAQSQRLRLHQPITPLLLEQYVFSRPYFTRHGLFLAEDEGRPVGFVHAGFGPNDDGDDLSPELGVISTVQTLHHDAADEISGELLRHAEHYLRQAGARVAYGGGISPIHPFYLGLCGGANLPGILVSNQPQLDLFHAHGYVEVDRILILQRKLAGFRPVVDRNQMQIRRNCSLDIVFDPVATNWWEACTTAQLNRTRFRLLRRGEPAPCGQATFWDLLPLANSWGVRAAGLLDLTVDESARRGGLATHLLGEALRELHSHGANLCELQIPQHDMAMRGLTKKLGFEEVDQGIVLRKQLAQD